MNILKFTHAFLFILFVLIFSETKAQSDFRSGYIITIQGDTVKGLIDHRSDISNAKRCVFKKETDQEKISYTPDQVKSYRFTDGKHYTSSSTLNHKFPNQVFVEFLSKGLLNIYYYKEDSKDHYYIGKDTIMVELDHHNRVTGSSGSGNMERAAPPKFRGQLKYLLWDQPSLFEKIEKIDCNATDLISLAKDYQKLSSPSQEYLQFEKEPLKGIQAKVGMFLSAGFSHLNSPPYNMAVSDYDVTKNLDFKTSFTYEIGALLNLYLNFIGENKYILQVAPALNMVEYESYKTLSLSPLLYSYKTNVKFTTLKVPILFKYSFYRSNSSAIPYFKLGPGWAIYSKQTGVYEYRSVPLNRPESQEPMYTESLNTSHGPAPDKIYFIGGTGIDIKYGKRLLSLGATYEYGTTQLKGHRSDAQVQIGLQF